MIEEFWICNNCGAKIIIKSTDGTKLKKLGCPCCLKILKLINKDKLNELF